MDINFRNISAFSQVTPEGLNSVTDGLTASVDARGIIAVDDAIQSFGEPGTIPFDQNALAGSTSNVGQPGSVSPPADYLKQVPSAADTQTPVLTNLSDPNFKFYDSVSTFFNHVFGKDDAVQDLASQVGIDPNARKAGYTGTTLPSSPETVTAPNTYSNMSGENPLESTIPAVILGGGPAANPLQASFPETNAFQDRQSSPLTSSTEPISIIPIVKPVSNQAGDDPDGPSKAFVHISGDNPAAAQFQMDLLRSNYTKLQDMGATLNQMLRLQQDVTDRRT